MPIWSVIQFFNFRFIPLVFQLPVANLFNVVWQCYLSSLNSHPEIAKKELVDGGKIVHDGAERVEKVIESAKRLTES
jgi:hypothetical protein